MLFTVFGDDDAEDAYSADDAPAERLAVLERLADQVEQELDQPDHDRARALARLRWAVLIIASLKLLPEVPPVLALAIESRLHALLEDESA